MGITQEVMFLSLLVALILICGINIAVERLIKALKAFSPKLLKLLIIKAPRVNPQAGFEVVEVRNALHPIPGHRITIDEMSDYLRRGWEITIL